MCGDYNVAVYVYGKPILAVDMLCDSVFYSFGYKDSCFCVDVCVVFVVL